MPEILISPKPGTIKNRNHKRELYAVCTSLSILGLVFSSWAARVPDIRDSATLTAATLGYALLLRGGGTITMMPIVAMGISHFGAKKVAAITGLLMALTLFPLALMKNWLSLSLLLLFVGACSSGFNISVNALGAKVEMETGKSHMSKIHSWFGIGNLAGALIGTAMVRLGVSTLAHFTVMTLLILVILASVYQFLPEDSPHPKADRPKFAWPHGGLIAIGIICFLAATIESSVYNWVALFFTDHIKADREYATVGYTVFAGALLAMRIIGDRLKTRFGARNLLITGSIFATGGILMSIFAPNIVVATLGFFIAGAGVSLNFPMIFSAAGREGAIALTSVATFGYFGGMISQPILGLIIEEFQIMGGFLFLALCILSVAILAFRARLLRV